MAIESRVLRVMAIVSTAKVVAGNVADVIHDVVQLGELQVQLFATDSRAALRRVILPVVLLLFGLVTTLGCLPVFVLAGAYAIETSTELTFVNSLLASAGVALLVGLVLMACGGLLLRRVTAEFDTSWYELSRNIDWIKRTLKRKSTLDQ